MLAHLFAATWVNECIRTLVVIENIKITSPANCPACVVVYDLL